MGILSAIVGGSAAKPIEAVGGVLDKLFTSDDERLDKKALLERLAQKPGELQVELNKVEAQHRTVFVAGWRPAVGWVCAGALGYNFIVRDVTAWLMRLYQPGLEPPPELAMEHLLTVLTGMLGFGGLRTYEKLKGVTK